MRLPPEIAACRYSKACIFELRGQAPYLRIPPGPTVQHLLGRPLRSPAGRWMETCRWVRVPAQKTQTKLGMKSCLNGLPHQLQDLDALIQISDTLIHLSETFPASCLKVDNPIIAQCLRLLGALQHVDSNLLRIFSVRWRIC